MNLFYFDANGDGKGDIAYVYDWGVAAIVENGSTGPGSFSFLTNSPYILPTSDYPITMAAGDLDGDGLLDWVWGLQGDNAVQVGRNASTPTNILFAGGNLYEYATGNYPYDVKIMDVDGDGRPDIIVANYGDGTVSVLRNLSTGPGNLTFAPKVDFAACTEARSLVVADFNGDGRPDIVVVGSTATGNNVVILTNACTPGVISFSNAIAIGSLNQPINVEGGDFNGDGKLDLAVSGYGLGELSIYQNNSTVGSISFALATNIVTAGTPREGTICDFNGDGQPDIAVADVNGYVSIYQNLSTGGSLGGSSFALANIPYGTGSGPVCVLSADMDGDGRPDIAVGDYYATNVIFFRNISQY